MGAVSALAPLLMAEEDTGPQMVNVDYQLSISTQALELLKANPLADRYNMDTLEADIKFMSH